MDGERLEPPPRVLDRLRQLVWIYVGPLYRPISFQLRYMVSLSTPKFDDARY